MKVRGSNASKLFATWSSPSVKPKGIVSERRRAAGQIHGGWREFKTLRQNEPEVREKAYGYFEGHFETCKDIS
jgi:hypothetical protein